MGSERPLMQERSLALEGKYMNAKVTRRALWATLLAPAAVAQTRVDLLTQTKGVASSGWQLIGNKDKRIALMDIGDGLTVTTAGNSSTLSAIPQSIAVRVPDVFRPSADASVFQASAPQWRSVYRNGLLMAAPDDYTAAGIQSSFTSPVRVGEIIQVLY